MNLNKKKAMWIFAVFYLAVAGSGRCPEEGVRRGGRGGGALQHGGEVVLEHEGGGVGGVLLHNKQTKVIVTLLQTQLACIS